MGDVAFAIARLGSGLWDVGHCPRSDWCWVHGGWKMIGIQ